ncbi:SDR family NAD(P)-dependent oxidoreductase [Roseovarius indicus]|uniref:SDR family NAD(P)-dependent oxidoreductase n=1 Tax=Roseovarius indicus TaxID=540747 RepID=UPI0013747180|nr:SDR family oxidoreductase [Roseovarius indicus]
MKSLKGRVAIVTGSTRNIGRAAAVALAEKGATVIINGRQHSDVMEDAVTEIRGMGGQAAGIPADVSSDASVAALVSETVTQFGRLDIVVSNVGIRKYRPFLEISPEEWDEVLRSNLSASFYLARHAIPHMQKEKWGRLVMVSGFDGFWGHVTHRAPNVAAKSGMHGLAKAIGREFGKDNITANTVAPGAINTERDWSQYPHQELERLISEIPPGRFGDPTEVAAAIAFLASPEGGFVNGQVTHVNGGHYMY